ncbi:MAG: VOC family protein [Roseibium sp.]|uniref:VOC family protein n=1 Tax=Roseibium sp. TaxID=1936156 RepID=UPI003D9C008F
MAARPNKSVDPANAVQSDQKIFCPMQSPVLHHVSLFVSDMKVSTLFYTEGLGLTLREEFVDIIGLRGTHRFPFTVASIFLEAGEGRYIELHPAGDGEMSPPGFPINHLALAVVDVDASYAQALASGGARFDIPIPNEEWDGTPLDVIMSGARPEPMRMAFLQGPSGELIELYQATNN